ncbi:sensor histidine kinase [Actinoplanes sp. KI2]|uniref:sensor histidine kinase n=1 Tax=Actinoplanes sp. KI2 TaxID=2983315 RepID=UPI0021D57C0D|nr:sensor histidine kinase [Actinoplanes sp. KI2]MCU7722322.1 sensor histidine kinase [Actinoplanes sp. KI2]
MFELASCPRTLPKWFWPVVDLAMACALFSALMIDWWLAVRGFPGWADTVLAVVLAVTGGVAYRWPRAALCVALAGCGVAMFAGHPSWPQGLVVLVALFYVGRRRPTREAFWITLGTIVVAVLLSLRFTWFPHPLAPALTWTSWCLAAAACGSAAQNYHLFLVSSAAEKDAELAEQRRAGRQMLTEERLRIARELHDTVGHSLTMISVQSGVAAHVLDSDPAAVRFALERIRESSSAALNEIRTTLGLLRGDEEVGPAMRSDEQDLRLLVESARSGGLPVELEVTGDRRELPVVVGVALYRLTQECLTNVARHARHVTRATVDLTFEPGQVGLEVVNDGDPIDPAVVQAGTAAGNGIAGMRERLFALGGSLTAAPVHEGGFRVTATMPTEVPR